MIIPKGKGFYIWQVPRCGDPKKIADLAVMCGIEHFFVKISDGIADFGIYDGVDWASNLIQALIAAGVEAWGWGYIYLNNAPVEAARAVKRIKETGVKGYVIDAESQAKGKPGPAQDFCSALRSGVNPGFPIGLSSYRFPSLHPELPWNEFRRICDFDMPQVYWEQAHNPGAQLRRCVSEFYNFSRKLPIVATGATYKEHGWMPTLDEVIEFMRVAGDLGITFNFWEWYDANFILPGEILSSIAAWHGEELPPPIPIDKVFVNTANLNIRNAPIVNTSTLIGLTTQGKEFEVTGRVYDELGRMWIQSGPSVHLAGWLVKEAVG